jgi:predicted ATP-dependent protease
MVSEYSTNSSHVRTARLVVELVASEETPAVIRDALKEVMLELESETGVNTTSTKELATLALLLMLPEAEAKGMRYADGGVTREG